MIALYYPEFAPPLTWIKDSLLVWDGFRTIVPEAHEPAVDTPVLNYLRSNGLYQPMDPSPLLRRAQLLKQLVNEFLHKVRDIEHPAGRGEVRPMRISVQKTSPEIFHQLQKSGFVMKSDPDWITLDWHVGNLFMQLLAKYIALDSRPTGTLVPCSITERVARETFGSGNNGPHCGVLLQLAGLLPHAAEDVSVEDLVSFRNRHQRELKRYQIHIRTYLRELSQVKSEDEFEMTAASLRDNDFVVMGELRRAAGSLLKAPEFWGIISSISVLATVVPLWMSAVAGTQSLIPAAASIGAAVTSFAAKRRSHSTGPLALIHSGNQEGLIRSQYQLEAT